MPPHCAFAQAKHLLAQNSKITTKEFIEIPINKCLKVDLSKKIGAKVQLFFDMQVRIGAFAPTAATKTGKKNAGTNSRKVCPHAQML